MNFGVEGTLRSDVYKPFQLKTTYRLNRENYKLTGKFHSLIKPLLKQEN